MNNSLYIKSKNTHRDSRLKRNLLSYGGTDTSRCMETKALSSERLKEIFRSSSEVSHNSEFSQAR